MAKRNSTKTATKEAMSASEPRFQMISKWQGMNIEEAAANWDFVDDANDQTDLPMNFVHVQNNVDTTSLLTMETRQHELQVFMKPDTLESWSLTGVSYMKGKWLYLVIKQDDYDLWAVIRHDVTDPDPVTYEAIPITYHAITATKGRKSGTSQLSVACEFTCIYSYLNNEEDTLIVLAHVAGTTDSCTFTGPISTISTTGIENASYIETPSTPAMLNAHQILPLENSYEYWRTVVDMRVPLDDEGGNSHTVSGTYGGYLLSDDVEAIPDLVEDGKWYVNEEADMYWKENSTVYTFPWPDTSDDQDVNLASFWRAYWHRKLEIDRTTFDRAWYYKQYNDPGTAPSSVIPNTWVNDPTDSNLTNPTLIYKWSVNPWWMTTNRAYDEGEGPDEDYGDFYDWLKPDSGEFTTNYVRVGLAANGDLWLLVNLVRGTTGGDTLLLQANGPEIPSRDVITSRGSVTVSNVNVTYAYANRFGQTSLTSGEDILTFDCLVGPATWTDMQYATLMFSNIPEDKDIEKINIYFTLDDGTDPSFVGAIDVPDDVTSSTVLKYDWKGSTVENAEWGNQNLLPDAENTTQGPDAEYCRMHDGRLYFWGSRNKPYRLFIGGNPGHELNMARGYGGAYIDIEPGIGTIVTGTYKWKTQSGASIVTILCGNENTSTNKRFNLVENNITVDNELSEKSYMVEEIANTVGCPSNWGAGVWQDGFYVLNRYGLTLTTMQMEYVSQMQSQLISSNVQPIFTDNFGAMIDNARMIYVDEHLYICFGTDDHETLDNVILCYSLNEKAWWTYTYGDEYTDILHIMNIDYKGYVEGIGIICPDHVTMIPTTGEWDIVPDNEVDFLIETGELAATTPKQTHFWIAQLELRFDYFIGDMDVDVDGVDYYGRHIKIHRHIHTEEAVNDFKDWIRFNNNFESYSLRLSGTAKFRMTHMMGKVYRQSGKIGITRGFDSLQTYRDRQGNTDTVHHYIRNYNNLRETLLT